MPGEEQDRSGADPESPTKPNETEEQTDDTEGQALTWKVRKPIPQVADEDTEGHGLRPPPDVVNPMPGVDDDDEVESHDGMTGSNRPPVA